MAKCALFTNWLILLALGFFGCTRGGPLGVRLSTSGSKQNSPHSVHLTFCKSLTWPKSHAVEKCVGVLGQGRTPVAPAWFRPLLGPPPPGSAPAWAAWVRPSWVRPSWVRPSWVRPSWVRPLLGPSPPGSAPPGPAPPGPAPPGSAPAWARPSWARPSWARPSWVRPGLSPPPPGCAPPGSARPGSSSPRVEYTSYLSVTVVLVHHEP